MSRDTRISSVIDQFKQWEATISSPALDLTRRLSEKSVNNSLKTFHISSTCSTDHNCPKTIRPDSLLTFRIKHLLFKRTMKIFKLKIKNGPFETAAFFNTF